MLDNRRLKSYYKRLWSAIGLSVADIVVSWSIIVVCKSPGQAMAKDGKKLELYEILAAKRAKGKIPLGVETKPAKQANTPDPEVTDAPGLIIDDAVNGMLPPPVSEPGEVKPDSVRQTVATPPPQQTERKKSAPVPVKRPESQYGRPAARQPTTFAPPGEFPDPAPVQEPQRPRSPREVVFALDTALVFFTVVLALVGCSYFIGYKRGQEERPAGLAGVTEIETADPGRLNIRHLSPPPRSAMRPPEHDYTLIIRKETASDDLPERLELELAEALARGRQELGRDIPGFIFRTTGADPHYILAVGLGQSANDQELNRLLKVYNDMEGINLSRQPRPYLGCRIAPVRELGTAVY